MILIILGIILFIVATLIAKNNTAIAKFEGIGKKISIVLVALGIMTSCVKQIDAGEIGVKILFGSIQKEVMLSGLHFINPLLDVKKNGCKNAKLHNEWSTR